MRKIASFICVLLCSFALFAGGQSEELVIKSVGIKNFDPTYIAYDMGFFTDEGIKVEIVDTITGGPSALQLVDSGDAQTAMSSIPAVLNAVNAGSDVIAVTDAQTEFADHAVEKFYVREDSGINSVADLKGKIIGINLVKSSFHYTWLMILEQNGIAEEEVTWVQIPFGNLVDSLKNGVVDAIGVLSPYDAQADNAGGLKLLFTGSDAFGARQFTNLFMNKTFAEQHPEEAKKWVSAIVRAMEFAQENPEKASEIIGKYSGVDPKLIYPYKYTENGIVYGESYEFWRDFLSKYEGVIPADMDVTKAYSNEYNVRAD